MISGYVRLAMAIAHDADATAGALISVSESERVAKRLIDALADHLGEGDVLF
jgi:hypothetical protein